MQPSEIQTRTNTLSNACIKVSALLAGNQPIVESCRRELVKHASELSIQARGLSFGQISSIFVERLNKSVDSCNGCAFWLQLVVQEKMMDGSIIQPLISESESLAMMFLAALRSSKIKSE